jgi:hypothetical protein
MNKPPEKAPPPPDSPGDETEELAHYDDAVIGRAFRWSAIAFVLIVVIALAVFAVLNRKAPPPPARVTQISAPVARPTSTVDVPEVRFTDITRESGVDFVHNNGAYGDKLLPETMGGGVVFFDYDNDGDPDLLFVNSTDWPGREPRADRSSTIGLYQNNGAGKFANTTAGSGLDVTLYGMGAAAGDFDNDGWVDVFVTGVGGNRLFRNLGGGRFQDITRASGVGGLPPGWSTAAAWMDYDNDGDLDLFVANYVRWSKEIDFEVGYKLVGFGRAYGQPMNFEGAFSSLYRNDGNQRFTDVSGQAGIQIKNPATGVPVGKGLGVAPVDLDLDGWIDLVVANDTVQNFVFHNQRDGTFQEKGAIMGVAFDSYGATRGAMGIDTGHFRNDGSLGIAIGNFANEMTALYVAQGNPHQFTDEAITEGIGPASRLLLKFGIFFFDYDLDGRLDVLTANGHLEEEIGKLQQSQKYQQPAQLFWNSGPTQAGFVSVPPERAGSDLFKPIVGRGSAYADIDGDGDLDVVLTQVNGPPLVLRNDQALNHRWIRVKLVGKTRNRDAIGAWVKLQVNGRSLLRQVMPTRSYLSQSELPVTFGLANSDKIVSAEIVWPGGKTQSVPVENLRLGATAVIEEK